MITVADTPRARRRRIAVIVGGVLTVGLAVGLLVIRPWSPGLEIPDEKAIAAQLLDQKLRGPRYFHPTKKPATFWGAGFGEIRIGVEDAKSQVPRISRARELS